MAGSLLDNRGRIESLWDKDFIEGVCGEKFRILNESGDYHLSYVIVRNKVLRHKHERRDETYFILDGEGLLEMEEGEKIGIGKNSIFNIPKGTFHSLERISGIPLAVMMISCPRYDVFDVVYPNYSEKHK